MGENFRLTNYHLFLHILASTMANLLSFLVVCIALYVTCNARLVDVIYNEGDLIGTCGNTCDSLPVVTNKPECRRITQCSRSQTGWERWFYRCDWCKCKCEVPDDEPEKELIEQSRRTYNEDTLWNTCKNTCNAGGLQRTNALGCTEIRNCVHQRNGVINGLYRCDHCECDCIIKALPTEYRLENVNYDLDSAQVGLAEWVVVGSLTIRNDGDFEEQARRTISIQYSTSRTWSMERSSSRTITAGVSVGITAKKLDLGSTLSVAETQSYSYSWGQTKTWTITDSITQVIVSPPHSERMAEIRGERYDASVPYTATLIAVYDDGREITEQVSGVLQEASVGDFQLIYGDHTPISVKRDTLME
ncbi:Natterin-4 [Holothuria leucospilota]|uniref:Natterin-4 n=1 Tax=Holothuria leucospilota TaxID=206669 RepID=A0A9Q1BG13_HOLLE|nr:Natterin-4 [Holothuria leucospilota]